MELSLSYTRSTMIGLRSKKIIHQSAKVFTLKNPPPRFEGCDEPTFSMRRDENNKQCLRRCEEFQEFIPVRIHICERDIPFGKYLVEVFMDESLGIGKSPHRMVFSHLIEMDDYDEDIKFIAERISYDIQSAVTQTLRALG